MHLMCYNFRKYFICLFMRSALLICGALISLNASAYYSDIKHAPASVQGYTTYGYASSVVEEQDNPSYTRHSQTEEHDSLANLRDAKVKQIQKQYTSKGVMNLAHDVVMPIDDEIDKVHHVKNGKAFSETAEITSNAFEKICSSLGYKQETEHEALLFHECVSHAMKTKLTEETLNKKEYNEIDINIVNQLSGNKLLDKVVENLIPYEQGITQRNKMECMRKNDYHKCTKAIVEYKACYNEAVETITFSHENNKITCYTKTAIRFPSVTNKNVNVRNSYFGMCMHLIEKDLKAKFIKKNAECNQMLKKGGILNLAI